jgi:long-subunit fatty acid transport protein
MKEYTSLIILFLMTLFFSTNILQADTIFQEVGIASSPNPVGSGARAMGMGGAFIAIADDATAASWNPSCLIQLEKPELSIVGAYLNSRKDFSSDIHPEINNTSKVDDKNINYFSATYPFQFNRNMVISFNYQRLYEFKKSLNHLYDYSPLGLSLLQDIHFNQKGYIGALGLAYAIEITPRLSLGTTVNIWTDELLWSNGWEENYTERSVGEVNDVPEIIDTSITDKYSKFRGINTNLGLLWNLNNFLTLGFVIKTPFDASIHHEFNFIQTTTYGPPVNRTLPGTPKLISEDIKLRMPLSYGIGFAWRTSDALSFDVDIYQTKWRDYILIDSQGNKFSPINGRPESYSDVKDTTQIRIGGEYLFINQKRKIVVPFRAGIFYDPEPSHGHVNDFYGVTVGSGIAYKKTIFDIAYQLRWRQDADTGNLIPTSRADVMQHLLLTSFIFHF